MQIRNHGLVEQIQMVIVNKILYGENFIHLIKQFEIIDIQRATTVIETSPLAAVEQPEKSTKIWPWVLLFIVGLVAVNTLIFLFMGH